MWIFDLDNTLYPAECNLFAQVDQRMGEFIAKHLGVPFEYARHLQKSYYRHSFGTTLAGLMRVHKMHPNRSSIMSTTLTCPLCRSLRNCAPPSTVFQVAS